MLKRSLFLLDPKFLRDKPLEKPVEGLGTYQAESADTTLITELVKRDMDSTLLSDKCDGT